LDMFLFKQNFKCGVRGESFYVNDLEMTFYNINMVNATIIK